jgi:TonB family protein
MSRTSNAKGDTEPNMTRTKPLHVYLFISLAIIVAAAPAVFGQSCVLRVTASESYPVADTPDNDQMPARKTAITGFTATVNDPITNREYGGVTQKGYVYFDNIPPGLYDITVRKAGYKTSIESHDFSCDRSDDGVDLVDVLMVRGRTAEIVRRGSGKVPAGQPNKYTVLGDLNYQGSAIENPAPANATKTISAGVLNPKAVSLPKPRYPAAAMAERASGSVVVQVLVDEKGDVISAAAAGGHPLLQPVSVEAARRAKFNPTFVEGSPVRVSGVIIYNFNR